MLSVHLRKEWREQRLLVGCGIAALGVLGVAVAVFAPAAKVPGDIAELFAMAALAIAFVVVTSDLIPGETRRGQRDWLVRMSDGLPRALVAKGIAAMAVFASLSFAGLAIGQFCDATVAAPGDEARPRALAPLEHPAAILAAFLTVLTPWSMALSCWLPRGGVAIVLTLCGGAAAMAWPTWVAAVCEPQLSLPLCVAAAVWLLTAGTVALHQSFRFGLDPAQRRRGTRGAALALLLGVAPLQLWAGERMHAFEHVRLDEDRIEIREVLLDADGTGAWCQITRRGWLRQGVHQVVRVNLADGAWTQIGGAQSFLEHAGPVSDEFGRQPQLHLLVTDRRGDAITGRRLLDSRDGRDLQPTEQTVTAPLRLPDGARVFQRDDVLVREAADGGRRSLRIPEGAGIGWGYGFGRRWFERGATPGRRLLDLDRLAVFDDPTAGTGRVFVRPGWWIVEHGTGDALRRELVDPVAGTRRPFDPGPDVDVCLVLADGRILCEGHADAALWILDVESEQRTTLGVPDTWPRGWQVGPAWSLRNTAGAFTPSGGTIAGVRNAAPGGRFYGLARIGADGTIATTPLSDSPVRLAAILDDDRILVIQNDSRELAILSFAGAPLRTVLRCGPAQ